MNIPLPKDVKINSDKGNKAQIVIEPCYPGYGVTLGNSLRRILLSSLEGGAITAFKVKGVNHEFSHLPNVKEDLIEVILNLKAIRLKIFSDEPVTLNLKVKGEKEVKARDIEKNSSVEIANPEQLICTVTDKSTELEIEFTAQKGHGYVTIEQRENEKVDIGVIKIDAIYTPMKNVGFEIENVRVGDRTDYEKLVLNIETNGTITPEQALKDASQILVDHFTLINGGKVKEEKKVELKEKIEEKVNTEIVEEKTKKKRGRPKKEDK